MEDVEDSVKLSIYRAARTIKRRNNSLYNALRSIYEDSIFVGEISQLWPDLPLLANLRCGLWYSPRFHSTCYFKSTDGHNNNWSFNTSRLNLHVVQLALQKGGCIIVDSTRKGKRFPDSMSKTIPIWTCVLNRCIARYRSKMLLDNSVAVAGKNDSSKLKQSSGESLHWDCSLHLPLWVSDVERASIEARLETWTDDLETIGADVASLVSLKKPLRPLWISQRTVIWLNEVPDHDSWDFTPIILLSASRSTELVQNTTTSEFSWSYISGAGDDEESWARGLSPSLFWVHAYDLINARPDSCNQKVADIVEKDRVYRAHRGLVAPQIRLNAPTLSGSLDELTCAELAVSEEHSITWLASTSIAIGSVSQAANALGIDCMLNCSQDSVAPSLQNTDMYMHLPVQNSKFDRFSLLNNLPSAVNFARANLGEGRTILLCCKDGEDVSICVCLAILVSLFTEEGTYDEGRSFNEAAITKWEMRRRLVFICKYVTAARPSRGNLKQVFAFLTGGRASSK
ncbi:hypothetical protein SAY87_008751 [Trapa incisa]|uniref:Initiator tRNA phosphoribosyl transferase family protein n=1 Tax=Trapa incisa TaxID=236973 RepID=A0AAN7JYC8_9MYRT|nr:hypothetical protein SAY87_008751 [Trapa incisa]